MMKPSFEDLPPPPLDLLQDASLLLDFDGTLVDIAPRPADVRVDLRLRRLMALLFTKMEGRIAIITGRPLDELCALFGAPSFAVAGSHGAELYWPDGRVCRPSAAEPSAELMAQLRWLESSYSGVIVEMKPLGLALHYRLAPQAEQACRALAQRLAEEWGYVIQSGKQVVELKAVPFDKGNAVDALMNAPPMAGTRPVFVGDDETDEAAFISVQRYGGAGVLVGPPRPTSACYNLHDVNDALSWLAAIVGADT